MALMEDPGPVVDPKPTAREKTQAQAVIDTFLASRNRLADVLRRLERDKRGIVGGEPPRAGAGTSTEAGFGGVTVTQFLPGMQLLGTEFARLVQELEDFERDLASRF